LPGAGAHCLVSVRGVFDEIVVVDTGSTDRTVEIARSFGANVFLFVGDDDFAAARNEAPAHATGDYVFWLDADDVVEPDKREKLWALLGRLKRPVVAAGEPGMGCIHAAMRLHLGAGPHPIPLPRRERAMTYLERRALGNDGAFLLRWARVS
jgi:glycosyltransferase involved in cell wall biosynthesis